METGERPAVTAEIRPPGDAAVVLAHRVALVSAGLLALTFSLRRIESADLPWQLAAGREILEKRAIPVQDRFALLSLGRPWLDVHWLAQAGMAVLEHVAGLVSIQLATAAIVLLSLVAAWIAAGSTGLLRAPVALLALLAAWTRFEPRPDLASLLFPPIILLILERLSIRARRLGPWLVALAALQALWTNVHGSFVLGPLFVTAYVAGVWLARRPDIAARRLAAAVAVNLGATLLNPRGIAVWRLFRPYVDAVAARFGAVEAPAPAIQEWLPTLSARARPYLASTFVPYALLLALSVLALALVSRRERLAPAFVLTLAALLSTTAVRSVAPFAFVALAVLPALLGPAADLVPPRLRRRGALVLAAATVAASLFLVLDVASNRFFARQGLASEVGPGWSDSAFPEGACGWVEAAGIAGQAFHNYEVGGYYLWRFDRTRLALLDGRLDLLAPAELASYIRAVREPALFEELARARGVTHVILKYAAGDASVLLPYLEGSRALWRRAYADGSGAVYVRSSLQVEQEAASPTGRPTHPLDAWAERAFLPVHERQIHLPVATLNLAMLHEAAGELSQAVAAYERSIAAYPRLPRARLRLASLYLDLGDDDQARAELARLEHDLPGDPLVAALRARLPR